MPDVVIRVDPERRTWWKETLSDLLPGFRIYLWDEDRDQYSQGSIDYAVVWMPPLGGLAELHNLKAVFSVGAGVTHILRDPDYPRGVPIVRTVNDDLRSRMVEYVLLHVLRGHRRLTEIEAAQAQKSWKQYVEPLARDTVVGILGVGNLGGAAAEALLSVGYEVHGWSRTGRTIAGVKSCHGVDGLRGIFETADVVVNMLPGTHETTDLLDASLFSLAKPGLFFVNVGRGETVVDDDLLSALNSGVVREAVLDVFRVEPLQEDSPYWTHPKVLITSHTASAIDPATGGRTIAENILAFESGDLPRDVVDMRQGY